VAESAEWLYFVKPLGMDLCVSIGRVGGECVCGCGGGAVGLGWLMILPGVAALYVDFLREDGDI